MSFSLTSLGPNLCLSLARFVGSSTLRALTLLALAIVLAPATQAQQPQLQYTKNTPDQTMRSDARVDPSSHALSVQIPLAGFAGRAGLGLPVSITYSSKIWHLEQDGEIEPPHGFALYYPYFPSDNDERSVRGWTTSLRRPKVEYTFNDESFEGAGLGMGQAGGTPGQKAWVPRIRVVLGDGSSHELRQDDQPRILTSFNNYLTGTYYAVDSSQLRFEFGTSNNTLYLPDGSRYIFNSQEASQYIDRNGNTISYTNGVWTDTRGHTFASPLSDTSIGDHQYSVPGVNNVPLVYTFKWRQLLNGSESYLASPYTELRYPGNKDCNSFNNGFLSVSPYLFFSNDQHNPICGHDRYNPVVLTEVVLPNGASYRLTYNPWGEIAKIYFPTGGYERYEYDFKQSMSYTKKPYEATNRGVSKRWVSADGITEDTDHPWQYGVEFTPFSSSAYVTTMTSPTGVITRRYLHAQPDPYDANVYHSIPFGFDDARSGMAYEENMQSGGAMLRRSLTEWTVDGPSTPQGWSTATRDPRVARQVEIIFETGMSSALAKTTTFIYDQDLNRISTTEHDYVVVDLTTAQIGGIGSIAAGAPLRTTEVTYLVNDSTIDATTRAAYRARNLLALPTSTRLKVGDATGPVVAKGFIRYDESAFPLISEGNTDGWIDPATTVRGNATTSGQWLSGSTYLETHARYDKFGNLRKSWDARDTSQLNPAQIDYSETYQYALPTTTTSPLVPDPFGQPGSMTALVTTTNYDQATGLVTSTVDANNQTTSFSYSDPQTSALDPLNRIRTVSKPDGGLTTFIYNDAPGSLSVQTLTKQDATHNLEATQYFDGVGRPVRSFLALGGGSYSTGDMQYDNEGRVWRVSSPYVSTGAGSVVNPSGNWTTTTFDALSRVVVVTTSDSAQVATSFGGSTSNFLGSTATVTDQSGKVRRTLNDALGRLVRVDEPTSNGLGNVDNPNQPTSYSYDVAGNLRLVTQGSQQRFFMYDALGRLIRAKNPEQGNFTPDATAGFPALTDATSGTTNSDWSMGFVYDDNGNLAKRRDARNIVATYLYDALNRSTNLTYTNDPANTPTVTRTYDGATNGRGKIWTTETAGSKGSRTKILSYDALGRPTGQSQQFCASGACGTEFSISATYDKAGNVLTQTYPSGHIVNYSYDGAGRTSNFSGNLGEGVTRTYASDFQYSEFGGIQQEKFGTDTPLYHKQRFNQRGQLWDMRLSSVPFATDPGDGDRGAIVNFYSNNFAPAGSNQYNNGNLLRQEINVPGNGYFQDNFAYDQLNRLTSASEKLNGDDMFTQAYTYDRWGNRTIDQTHTTTNVPHPEYTIDTANNRLLAPAGYTHVYDDAGNQTRDTYTTNSPTAGNRTFDAENRIIDAEKPVTGKVAKAYYTYNGDGQRVRRKIATFEIWQIYGFAGELLAEYPQNGPSMAVAQPQKEYGYRNGQLLVTAEPYTNLAWNQPATQTDNLNGNTATQAVDGDVEGDLAEGHTSATNSHANSWWQVDLQSVQTISSINIWGRTDCCREMTSDFYIFVSDSPFTSTDLSTTQAQAGVSDYAHSGFSGPTSSTPPTSIDVNRTGRYVRVQLAGTGSLALGEVQVWTQAAKVQWLVTDHLGTPRISVDKTGSLAGVSRHDYLPSGEDLTVGRSATPGYSTSDNVRQKFTEQERDTETGLDYFGARFYASNGGRFTSTDPLMASANPANPQTWNRYSYSLNNPERFTDPSGMEPGDFYNEDLDKKLGTDGIQDGKLYVVTNDNEAKKVQQTDKAGGTTSAANVGSAIELPSFGIRQEIGEAVKRSNNPTSDDKEGGHHEEGITWGTNAAGGEQVVRAAAGPASNPLAQDAHINLSNFANPADNGVLVDVKGTSHVHPAKGNTVTTGPAPMQGIGTTIGGERTTAGAFNQKPSRPDFNTAMPGQTNIVVGAGTKRVYIYNQSSVKANLPLDRFLKLK